MPSRKQVPPSVKKNRGIAPPNTSFRKRRRSNGHGLIRARLWRHRLKAPVTDRPASNESSTIDFTLPVTAGAVTTCTTSPPRSPLTSESNVTALCHTSCVEPKFLYGLSTTPLVASYLTAVMPYRTLLLLVSLLTATSADAFFPRPVICPLFAFTKVVIWLISLCLIHFSSQDPYRDSRPPAVRLQH